MMVYVVMEDWDHEGSTLVDVFRNQNTAQATVDRLAGVARGVARGVSYSIEPKELVEE